MAVHGRVDPVALGVGIQAKLVDGFLTSHLRHVGGLQLPARAVVAGVHGCRQGRGQLVIVNQAQFVHASEDPVPAGHCALGIDQRVERRGCLGQAGDQSELVQGQFADGFSIVHLGGGFDTVGTAAEVDQVGVEGEDFLLVELFLNAQGQEYLVELADKALLGGEEEIARQLHGDGAATGLDFPGGGEFHGGAHQASDVYPVVVVEAVVLRREDGVDEVPGYILIANGCAALFTEFAHQAPVPGVDPQGCLKLDGAQGFGGR